MELYKNVSHGFFGISSKKTQFGIKLCDSVFAPGQLMEWEISCDNTNSEKAIKSISIELFLDVRLNVNYRASQEKY